MREGRPASTSQLVHALWGHTPPRSEGSALRTHAARLRSTLGSDALAAVDGGYAMRLEPDALDLSVVKLLAAQAGELRAAHPGRARELLNDALDFWQCEPLAGLSGPYFDMQRIGLVKRYLSLRLERCGLDITLGLNEEAVQELTVLSAEQPLQERVRYLLMLALYRSGRQAEALGVYADTRRILVEQLGIDPSRELRDSIGCAHPEDPTESRR